MATITTSPTQQRAMDMNVLARKQRSLWQDALWRLRRNKAAMLGLGIIAAAVMTHKPTTAARLRTRRYPASRQRERCLRARTLSSAARC